MKSAAVLWMILTALLLSVAGCAPEGTSGDGTGKSSPNGKSIPAPPKPPRDDPG
ncbi:MAG TPA: hypothetical protein VKS79_06970 [Gemmataceae bacterium]|nr:hypothetical protein [Gemmataceae bacterium]